MAYMKVEKMKKVSIGGSINFNGYYTNNYMQYNLTLNIC